MEEEICIHFSALTKNPVQWAPNTFYAILSNDGESVTCYITSKTGEPKIVTSDGSLVFENLNFNSEKHTIAKIGINDIEETVTSFEKFELNGTDLEIEFNKEDGTKQVITLDLSSLGDNNCGCPTGLEIADEGNGNGWRLIGRNPDNYGNLGNNAIDFSVSNSASTTIGATGDRSVQFGRNNTTSGKGSMTLGENNINPFNNSLVVGSKFIGESTNGYSEGNVFLADYAKNNLKAYNNIYSSLIGGSDASVGTQGATLNQAVVYQSIINGWNSNIYGGESSLAVGHALLGGAARCAIVGAANIDLTQTTATQRTDDRQAYNPRFIVGVGDWNSDSNTGTRANGFVVMSDGTASFPSLTNTMIDSSSGKSAVTKDWVIANSGGSTGLIDVMEGTNITIDKTDPQKPIISATGGGGLQNLQEVTDIGNETTNNIIIDGGFGKSFLTPGVIAILDNSNIGLSLERGKIKNTANIRPGGFELTSNGLLLSDKAMSGDPEVYMASYLLDRIVISPQIGTSTVPRGTFVFPNLPSDTTERRLPVSVNGEIADANGNITIPTGGGVQSVTGDGVSGTPEDVILTYPTPADIGAIEDAPADGEIYARKDNTWVKVFEGLGFIATEYNITSDSSSITLTMSDPLEVGIVTLNGEVLRASQWSQTGTSITVTPPIGLKETDYIGVYQISPRGTGGSGGSGVGTLLKDVQFIGDGSSTTITVTHGLNTEDLSSVRVIDVNTKEVVQTTEVGIDSNSYSLSFNTAPTLNQYKVITTA